VYSRTFDGRGFNTDFGWEDLWVKSETLCANGPAATKICRSPNAVTVPQSDLLNHLWKKAVAEWK
jgi:hypothetical protein